MLEWQPKGTAWSDRSQFYEDENAVRSSMTGFLDSLGRGGVEASILTPELVEKGALGSGIRVLILPRVLALSEREAAQIRRFVANGGIVIAEGVPGRFDQHCRRLQGPMLASLFRAAPGKAILFDSPPSRRELLQILAHAGVEPIFTLARKDGSPATDIETHVWRNGETTILGLQREMSDAAPEPLRLSLRAPARVYDLRARSLLGTVKSLELAIDRVTPALLALSTDPGPAPAISGASRAIAGGPATLTFSLPQRKGAAVLRVEVVDPQGEVVPERSANILLRGAPVAKPFEFAASDATGKWQIRARDVLKSWRDGPAQRRIARAYLRSFLIAASWAARVASSASTVATSALSVALARISSARLIASAALASSRSRPRIAVSASTVTTWGCTSRMPPATNTSSSGPPPAGWMRTEPGLMRVMSGVCLG
jgi:hypothetical protein